MPNPLGPPYRIVTPRLVLRCWEPGDAPALSALVERNLDSVRRHRGREDEPRPLEGRLAELRQRRAGFDLDDQWSYAVLTAGEGVLAGAATLFRVRPARVDIGFTGWCGTEYAGRGYAAEVGAALARAAFELLDAPRLHAACPADDAESAALFRELGFTHDGAERHLDGDGARRDEMLWSMLPDEWPASPAAVPAADVRAFGVLGDRLF
jgi:RimJ/RimL family protein N-acetyltransferase